eukprot:scaffold17506_cov132-Isochrysis_galbana.AAC.12
MPQEEESGLQLAGVEPVHAAGGGVTRRCGGGEAHPRGRHECVAHETEVVVRVGQRHRRIWAVAACATRPNGTRQKSGHLLGSPRRAPQRLGALPQHRRALGRRATRDQPLRFGLGGGARFEHGREERGGGTAGGFAAQQGEGVDA